MNRPGGGPVTGGEQAPRIAKEVQQAWWTGWKKLHGLKWQTVFMPNGMDFHVWGPASVRRNDNHTLNKSSIREKLRDCQLNQPLQYKMFGDSAYFDDTHLVTGGGRGMASCRETIEWEYKDLKTYWKYCDYKHVLKLRKQPIAKIVFTCMLLRNAHNTLYGSQTTAYFNTIPPTLEEWFGQGPQARPIPDDIIFAAAPAAEVESDEESDVSELSDEE